MVCGRSGSRMYGYATTTHCGWLWLIGSPRSPLSGCLYRDVTWGTESLYPIQIQWNMAELYGGLRLNPRQWGRGLMQPPMSFSELDAKPFGVSC